MRRRISASTSISSSFITQLLIPSRVATVPAILVYCTIGCDLFSRIITMLTQSFAEKPIQPGESFYRTVLSVAKDNEYKFQAHEQFVRWYCYYSLPSVALSALQKLSDVFFLSVSTIQKSGTSNSDPLFTEMAFLLLEWQECPRETAETTRKRERNESITKINFIVLWIIYCQKIVIQIILTKFCYGE
jgi:hypothetical protein